MIEPGLHGSDADVTAVNKVVSAQCPCAALRQLSRRPRSSRKDQGVSSSTDDWNCHPRDSTYLSRSVLHNYQLILLRLRARFGAVTSGPGIELLARSGLHSIDPITEYGDRGRRVNDAARLYDVQLVTTNPASNVVPPSKLLLGARRRASARPAVRSWSDRR